MQKDFVAGHAARARRNLILAANPKLRPTIVRELIALAKAKPGKLNYGSTGIGNPLHLTMEMLKHARPASTSWRCPTAATRRPTPR